MVTFCVFPAAPAGARWAQPEVLGAAALAVAVFSGAMCLLPMLAAILIGLSASAYLYRQFGGVSGDICGAVVTVSELAGFVCLTLCARL